uniref:RNA-directed DNA polymerase from mobile element jockey n=1 Tax=Sipha flava TaxID=143950 RepID=A0A2S2QTG3_9HEMI
MCKALEKIIDFRLRWFLEKTCYLSPQQNGFRKNRSIYNNIHNIQKDIIKSQETNQAMGLVALDIAKAYDTTWRPRIIEQLQKILCNGNLLIFIKNFLEDRFFKVKINGHLSSTFNQENCVPQGSTLSVTLFLVAINYISERIKFPVKSSLFADDLNIWCSGKNTQNIQPYLQDTLLSLAAWSEISGNRFSSFKSQSIIFTRTTKYPSLDVRIYNTQIQTSRSIKILGITFDRKNTWNSHLKDLRKVTMLRMNILETLTHTSWGANSITLKQIYTSYYPNLNTVLLSFLIPNNLV